MSSIDRRLTALEEKSVPPSFREIELVAAVTMTKSEADQLASLPPSFSPHCDVVTRIEMIGVLPEAEIIQISAVRADHDDQRIPDESRSH